MPAARGGPAPRRRGRPPVSENLQTATRLLDAATAVCAERGFDGTTLALIAERAGVHPTALYNHFKSREHLLHAAADRAIEQITTLAIETAGSTGSTGAVAAVYLRPEMRDNRRLIAELHVASARDPQLASLLAAWHRTWEQAMLQVVPPDDPHPRATVKAYFLLLLGLCHYDDVQAVRAPRAAVTERIERVAVDLISASAEAVEAAYRQS